MNSYFGVSKKALIIFFAVFLIFSFSCKKKEAKKEEVIKIGAILPLTGPVSWLGENAKNGIQFAVDEINAKEKIKKIIVIFEDSRLDPKMGVSIANRLIEIEKVNALIASGTTIVNAIMPITEKNNILLFAQTIHPEITKMGKKVFRIYGAGDYEWAKLAEYINENILNVGIFHINAQYGIDSKNMLLKSLDPKIKVLFSESYDIATTNFRSLVVKVKDKPVDAIILMGYGNEFIALIRQIKELGFKGKILGNIDFTFDFLQNNADCQGAIFIAPSFSVGKYSEIGELFARNYSQKFKKSPSWDVANSYDTIYVLHKAVEQVGEWNTEHISKYLANIKNYHGVSGKFSINTFKDAVFDLYISTLQNYQIMELK